MKVVLSWLVVGLVVPVQEIFVLPWLLYRRPSILQNTFSSPHTISIPLSPIAQQAGRAAAVLDCKSLGMWL
jgi:hypothetical protein